MVSAKNSKRVIRLAVVDDHVLFRKGLIYCILSQMRECKVVLEADDGAMLIGQLNSVFVEDLPDILLLDTDMPTVDGFEVLPWLAKYCPDIKVIMLASEDDSPTVIRCLHLGANAIVFKKDAEIEELVSVIRKVHASGEYYSPYVAGLAVAALKKMPKDPFSASLDLTAKELEFLRLSCSEFTYKEIADTMCISQRTADIHRDRLFEKLNVRTRVGLCLFAIRNKIIQLSDPMYSQISSPLILDEF